MYTNKINNNYDLLYMKCIKRRYIFKNVSNNNKVIFGIFVVIF